MSNIVAMSRFCSHIKFVSRYGFLRSIDNKFLYKMTYKLVV